MKRNTDWTDAMRSALRDAEVSPSEGGWERLQRELEGCESHVEEPRVPTSRRAGWRIYGPRIAVAAAVVLVCVVTGELLWHADRKLGVEVPVLASMTEAGDTAVDRSRIPASESPSEKPEGEPSESGSLRERLAEASGWAESPAATGPDEAAKTLLARATPVSAPTPGSEGAKLRKHDEPVSGSPNTEDRPAVEPVVGSGDRQSADEDPTATRVHPETDSETSAAAERSAVPTRSGQPQSDERTGTTLRNRSVSPRMSADPFDGAGKRTSAEKTSLSLFAGGGMTGSNALGNTALRSYSIMANDAVSVVGNGNNFSPMQRRDYDESSFRHHLPLSFGFTVRKGFSHGLSLESGVVYTFLRSDVRLRYSSEDVGQKLHFIGIPLRLNWQFVERGPFSAYLGAGGMAEKCVSAKFGSETIDEAALQWSILAALGAQYRLSDYVGLYFEPEFSYYFTDTELRTSRSDAPLTLTLRLGVRVLF